MESNDGEGSFLKPLLHPFIISSCVGTYAGTWRPHETRNNQPDEVQESMGAPCGRIEVAWLSVPCMWARCTHMLTACSSAKSMQAPCERISSHELLRDHFIDFLTRESFIISMRAHGSPHETQRFSKVLKMAPKALQIASLSIKCLQNTLKYNLKRNERKTSIGT